MTKYLRPKNVGYTTLPILNGSAPPSPVLLSPLEKFGKHQGLFSNMQFSFKEGVGCTEVSFTTLESINHMLEEGSKVVSGCFLDFRKAFYTVWIEGLLFKLFSEFGIKGRMWLVIKKPLHWCESSGPPLRLIVKEV